MRGAFYETPTRRRFAPSVLPMAKPVRCESASLRYLDSFVKLDGTWLFAERLLYVDWLDDRLS